MSRSYTEAEHAALGYHDDPTVHALSEILGRHFAESSQCNDDGYFDQCDCAERVQAIIAAREQAAARRAWDEGHEARRQYVIAMRSGPGVPRPTNPYAGVPDAGTGGSHE